MPVSKGEYEVVDHGDLADIKVFLVALSYRNPHIHREFELCQVLSGAVRVSSEQETHDVAQGGFFIINPHQAHEIHAIGGGRLRLKGASDACEILSLQVSPRWCERFFPKMAFVEFGAPDVGAALDVPSLEALRGAMRELALAYFSREPAFEFACVSHVAAIFHLLLTGLPWRTLTERERSARVARSERVNRITEYVEEHCTERLLLSDIARREGLTLAYLSHFFRDSLSMSFQRFVTLLRFDEARYLIERTDMPITDVSLTCGFSDYRYLNRIYVEKLGVTPAEYRKARRNSASPGSGAKAHNEGGVMNESSDKAPFDRDRALSSRQGRGAKQRFYSAAESIAALTASR
jgi:AraC-like DNA-binding protein